MSVPKTKRAAIGAMVGIVMLTAFIVLSVLLAIYNLSDWTAIIPSTIWLLLVGFMLGGFIKTDGCKKITTDILGASSWNEFVRTVRWENGNSELQYGFQIFGRRFSYFTVAVEKIETVNWSTGQASSMAGRDMNDWHVVVWYDHNDPAKSQKDDMLKKPDQDLCIIGMSGTKAETSALGHSVLDLLRKTGATYTQGENDCTFVRQSFTVAQI
jgi:hypothetical protein